jgi:hypothetical protein
MILYLLCFDLLLLTGFVQEILDLFQYAPGSPRRQRKEHHALRIASQHTECVVIGLDMEVAAADRKPSCDDLADADCHGMPESLML